MLRKSFQQRQTAVLSVMEAARFALAMAYVLKIVHGTSMLTQEDVVLADRAAIEDVLMDMIVISAVGTVKYAMDGKKMSVGLNRKFN